MPLTVPNIVSIAIALATPDGPRGGRMDKGATLCALMRADAPWWGSGAPLVRVFWRP
jgi:hypothetical protein